MTGGNALAAFIKMIQQWVIQLGVNVTQVIQTFKYVLLIFFFRAAHLERSSGIRYSGQLGICLI